MKIFIIMPVYNEEGRGVEVVRRILKVDKNIRLIIVDDGSIDNSFKEIQRQFGNNKRIKLLHHLINLGKGAAMKTGVLAAWKLGAEAVIFVDADGQHNPKYLKGFIEKLNNFPIVFGYRLLGQNVPWVRRAGNKFADWVVKVFFDIKRRDSICGFWGFRREVYQEIKWQSFRYEVEIEVSTRVAKRKIPFSEIKIDTIYIDKYKGVTIFDAFKILLKIPYWYFKK
jgi:glycosyltransferase involved in cell wall biosynthesis